MCSRWFAVLSLGLSAGLYQECRPETRPHYGGVLRVEVRESFDTADPPQTGPGMASLAGFSITHWEAGKRAVYSAAESSASGRPFLDSIEIEMAKPLRDQSIDLDLGKADVVELPPGELRRQTNRKTWSSMPVRVLALVFGARVDDARIREALALAVDRGAIHSVLLQRQGEISGALLPQWLSGYAYLFAGRADLARAKSLAAAAPASARVFTLGVRDAAIRSIADRIAVNARDAGLSVAVTPQESAADVKLIEARVNSAEPARALSGIAAAFGFSELSAASPEALYAAERGLLESFRIVPLFHLPDVYGVSPRVKGGPGITPLGEWRFGDLWVEAARP